MMRASSQKKSLVRSVSKPKQGPAKTTKPDSRLLDAEQFLLPTYKRPPVVMTHGSGAFVFDSTGKKYLDFLGGIAVNALGHAHPRIVKVIRREAARAIHLSNLYHNTYQGPLARKLAGWSGMDRVFFSNSGTEAIDGAMKLARLCGRQSNETPGTIAKKHRFLALENSFHGRTFGAISVTSTEKYRLPFAPVVPGTVDAPALRERLRRTLGGGSSAPRNSGGGQQQTLPPVQSLPGSILPDSGLPNVGEVLPKVAPKTALPLPDKPLPSLPVVGGL